MKKYYYLPIQLQTPTRAAIGGIQKKNLGWRKEMASYKDDFIIYFPGDLALPYKIAVIVACVFIVSYIIFLLLSRVYSLVILPYPRSSYPSSRLPWLSSLFLFINPKCIILFCRWLLSIFLLCVNLLVRN